MHTDPVLLGMFRFLHVNGCTPPHRAVWAVERLLDGMDGLPPETARARAELACAFLRQALVFNPLDVHVDGLLGSLESVCPLPPLFAAWRAASSGARAEAHARSGAASPEDAARIESLAEDGDAAGVAGFASEEYAPVLRFMALVQLWQMGERDEVVRLYPGVGGDPFLNPAAPFFAFALKAAGEQDAALELAGAGPENFLSFNLRAGLALEKGDTETARRLYLESLEHEPGQTWLALKLRRLDDPAPSASIVRDSRVHIGFYTFNKLDVTLSTLESLLESDIGETPVTLLNNGSTAFNIDEFDAGVERIAGRDRVRVIHLPVNIGAPAARNWLYRLPESDEADYYAFLDDDVLLPRDWLARFLATMRDDPKATGVGAKVVEPFPLPVVQYAYRYFLQTGPNFIRFTDNAPMVMDLGQFDLRRPCLSVMGCCHLFDRAKLDELGVGDFDIRFSPSQVDDLERDIRIWERGGKMVYDGSVQVTHLKGTGPKVRRSASDTGRLWGNHMKMERKYTAERLAFTDQAVVREDGLLLERSLDVLPKRARRFSAVAGGILSKP